MLIPYLGDKSKFSQFILPNIPEHETYCEAFSGMFGLFISSNLSPKTVIYNDVNEYNYILFRFLKSKDFINQIERISITEELFEMAKEKISVVDNDFTKAIYWLIILTCTNNVYDVMNSEFKNEYEYELFKLKYINLFNRINLITNIENLDYKDVINKYDSEDSFFYLDPPYYGKEHYYINHNFNKESHVELSNFIKSIKGKFMISYYQFPLLNDLYKEYRIESFRTLYGTELIIMNY
jgi:DNA adenine methylase